MAFEPPRQQRSSASRSPADACPQSGATSSGSESRPASTSSPAGIEFLADDEEFVGLARERGVELRDLRRPPDDLRVSTGANLEHDATVVLTVGSDCAIGKKTVAVELDREARRRGLRSVFVPTGQTGIMIAGWGSPSTPSLSTFSPT